MGLRAGDYGDVAGAPCIRRLRLSGELGDVQLHMSLDCDEDELRKAVRELIFEDELRDIPELADEPRWEDMVEALGRRGIAADEESLGGLPFVVEADDQVLGELKR